MSYMICKMTKINGEEKQDHLCYPNGEAKLFSSVEKANDFLFDIGYTQEQIELEGIFFKETYESYDEKDYSILIGHSDNGTKELRGINEVAEYICSEGINSDVTIIEPDGTFVLNTFGIFINKISDMNYRAELLEILIPMQHRIMERLYDKSED